MLAAAAPGSAREIATVMGADSAVLRRLRGLCDQLSFTLPPDPVLAPSAAAAAPVMPAAAAFDMRSASPSAIAAHVDEHGYAVLLHALSPQEVRDVNAWVDASLTRTPDTWGQVASGGQHGGRAEYMHPLLDEHGAELDYYARHPRILPTVRQLLGGDDACFTQFDFRQSPGGLELRNDLHHDVGSARTSAAETIAARPYGRHDTLCSIVYLTDVHEASPAFAVVPGSHRVPVWPKPGAPQRDAETDAVLCASPALSPLLLIFSYNSEKSLWGAGTTP